MNSFARIYFDNQATTMPSSAVLAKLASCLESSAFGNASSVHAEGRQGRARLIEARSRLAQRLGVDPKQLTFTSGATEGLNALLYSTCLAALQRGKAPPTILLSDLDHPAVYEAARKLAERRLCKLQLCSPEGRGALTLQKVEENITPDTSLIALLAGNNETGILAEVDAIAEFAAERGIPLVIDAVASFGKAPLSFSSRGAIAWVVSGHKLHALPGCGLMITSPTFPLVPLLVGGAQENGRRAGTENLLAIEAFVVAVEELFTNDQKNEGFSQLLNSLRRAFETALIENIPCAEIVGRELPRLPHISSVCFRGVDGESLLQRLDLRGLSASMGSACSSGSLEPSRVLINMKISHQEALSTLRFSFGWYNTLAEVEQAVQWISEEVAQLIDRSRS